MIYLSDIKKFSSYISGEPHKNTFESICTDSRVFNSSQLFIAITGEKFNAFQFSGEIIKKGGRTIVYSHGEKNQKIREELSREFPSTCFIKVSSSITFLQELAEHHRKRLKELNPGLQIISLSGSNGKTTCKDMLTFLCSIIGEEKVISTRKNDNNHIGVPLTLLKINERTQVAIIELGSNHPGEIPLLHRLVDPDQAYVTNIGETHLEFFHNLENVFKEESYPLSNLKKGGIPWVNMGDNFLKNLQTLPNARLIKEDILFKENPYLIGDYNFHNLGAMLKISESTLGKKYRTALIKQAKKFKPQNMRSQWVKKGETKVFLDAYNANPSSMYASVKAFQGFCKKNNLSSSKIFYILGDMRELGSDSKYFHEKLGKDISHLPIENIIFIGEFAKDYQRGFGRKSLTYKNLDLFLQSPPDIWSMDYLFLKASRYLEFERILLEK